MSFNDQNFMLQNNAAIELYEKAKDIPIFDFHCHLDPQEIYEDKVFDNIVDIWLGGDHYKWRLMRSNGVSEELITGDASNEDKFKAYAETVGVAVGNPLFHWSNLELKAIFGIDEYLHGGNWETVYKAANAHIKETQLSPRKLIEAAKVKFIGTTDHPLDSLEWHQKIKDDASFDVVVAPTFRPDEAFVNHANFKSFVNQLGQTVERDIDGFAAFISALEDRISYFAEHGAKASDISLAEIIHEEASEEEINQIFTKAMAGEQLSKLEEQQWQTAVFSALCGLYKKYNMTTQVHFGALRNNNRRYYELAGADAGFDSMGDQIDLGKNLNALLNALSETKQLPKMIWYNLNPQYNTILSNTLVNFHANEEGIKSQLQFGAAWWFADTKLGMLNQMQVLAEQNLLANFVGMLTDSRSFLSFQRHDYFRRILCTYLGELVELEEIPNDDQLLTTLIENICFANAERFFA